jgi:KDO2-lipid IV(A) lauroyltransferase
LRRTGFSNLDLVYGDGLSRREKARRLKQCVDNICIVAAEFSRIKRLRGGFLDQHVTIKGADRLPRDRGAIIIGGHQANWEWLAPALANKGMKVAEVVRPLSDPVLNDYVDKTRRAGGIVTIPKEGATHEVARYLREGYHVGILVDQSPRENGVPLRFLDRECWGTIGPVVLSRMTGAPIFGVFMQRGEDGRYELEILPEIALAGGKLSETIVENCQRCQDVVASGVERNPGQWLWLHRRWKSQPRLEREWQKRQEKE